MKKIRFLAAALALVLALLPVTPAIAPHQLIRMAQVAAQPTPGSTFWFFQLRDERGQPITAAAQCFVYTAGGDTLATIYTDSTLGTSAANPISAAPLFQSTGNSCAFFTASSVTSVDVIAWTKRARSRLSGFTPAGSAGHVVILDQQMTTKIIQVPFSGSTAPSSGTSYVNTGVTIPKGFTVRDVFVQVTTAGAAASHLVVGLLESNPNGFCAGTATAKPGDSTTGGKYITVAGWSACHAVVQTVVEATGGFFFSGFHSGGLISAGFVGTASSHQGFYIKFPFVGDGVAKTLSYHMGTANAGNPISTAAGYFYVVGEELGNDF